VIVGFGSWSVLGDGVESWNSVFPLDLWLYKVYIEMECKQKIMEIKNNTSWVLLIHIYAM